MDDTVPNDAAVILPAELPSVGVIILAAAPQLGVQKDRMVVVAAARKAFLANLIDAYGNCGHPLRDDWKFPSGETWEVTPELAEQIADHAPLGAALVSLGSSVQWLGRHDIWWSQDAEWHLAKHLMRRRVAVSLVSVRTATTAEVIVYRAGNQWPVARLIDLATCLLTRAA